MSTTPTPTPPAATGAAVAITPEPITHSLIATATPGVRKAAILMVVLGEATSAELLKQLDEDEVQQIGREIARIISITSEQSEAVLEEFYSMSMAHDYVLKGGMDYARKILISAFGPEQAKKMLDRLVKALGVESANFDSLQKADPQQLAKFIHNEHPQTIALILSHLNPSQAAGLIVSLPPDLRADVALRMANLEQISPEIIAKIANIIGSKLKSLGEISRESYGGVRAVSEMFNRLDSGTSKEVLDSIEQTDPNLVETIRHLMFVFEDLLLLGPEAVKEVLSRVDRKILTVALKGTSDQLKSHFLGAMSQRGAEMMREDMDSLGPIKIKEVETAQQQIIAVVRQLENDGTISLKGTVGDQYVS
jgi:flagellar motor switch protein FliG